MIRFFDFSIAFFGIIILTPLLLLLSILIFFEHRSPFFIQQRIGKNQKIFFLIKFRTLNINTKSIPTHFLDHSKISSFGLFLRKSKFDELPQLINILLGHMSLVGPRPCLLSQKKLIAERKKRGVLRVRPGITGLAQTKGITMQTPTLLAKTDAKMIKQMNLYYYFYYIFMTFFILLKRK